MDVDILQRIRLGVAVFTEQRGVKPDVISMSPLTWYLLSCIILDDPLAVNAERLPKQILGIEVVLDPQMEAEQINFIAKVLPEGELD